MIGYDEWHWMPTQEEIDELATAIAQSTMGPNVQVKCYIKGLLPAPKPAPEQGQRGGEK